MYLHKHGILLCEPNYCYFSLSLALSPPYIDHETLKVRPMPHDLPSQSHDQLEELAVEVLEQLQSEQVSLDQYCSSVITSTAPLLPGYLNKQLTWATPEGEGLPLGGAGICRIVIIIME